MHRRGLASGPPARRRLGFLLAFVLAVMLVVGVWMIGSSSPVPVPDPPGPDPVPAIRTPRPSPGPGVVAPVPPEGAGRPFVARAGARSVWFAPAPEDEEALTVRRGPLPETLPVDKVYPTLHPGDIQRAMMVMGVVDDSAVLRRMLVLDESWQVFELDPANLGRATGGPTMSRGALSPDGTRVALGESGSYLVVDLRDLSRRSVAATHASTGRLFWSHGSVRLAHGSADAKERGASVAELVTTDRLGGVHTAVPHPSAVSVDGNDAAMLVLDGRRQAGCCAVAGWNDPHHVLFESRTGPRLHLLDWNIRTGQVSLVSTIEPVVSNDWYLATSYADLSFR